MTATTNDDLTAQLEGMLPLVMGIRQRLDASQAELIKVRATLQNLLDLAGSPDGCADCGKPILWIRHRERNRAVPHNTDGTPHSPTCPKRFSRGAKR